MKIYRTRDGILASDEGRFYRLPGNDWDELLNREDLAESLERELESLQPIAITGDEPEGILAPVGQQEVWAAGVTYLRSRSARMEESKDAGGGTFYDRVYDAPRPEIFFKSNPARVIPTGGAIRIRRDSKWNVPEPELALVVDSRARIVGYTIGNDVSSRDIEGENPLYLPQAKTYDGACALGPCVLVTREPIPADTAIELEIVREGQTVFAGATSLSQMKRKHQELVDYLYLETSFPAGAVLLTGTGIIPEDSFTLQSGDEVRITIPPIGTLANRVA